MKTFLRHILLACALFLPGTVHAQSSVVIASARVDSVHYLVGDPITLHVEIRHPAGTTLQPVIADTLDAFHLLARQPLRQVADTLTAATVVVARYDSGTSPVPPLQFMATLPGDSARAVATNPVSVTVHRVSVDTTLDIKDVKPPLRIPFSLAELAMYVGIILLLAAVGYYLYRRFRKRERQAESAPAPPARPPHLVALEELQRLKEEKLWQRGYVKEYYTGVTEIVRRYIEQRYRVPALEETTEEIMQGMRSTGAQGLDTLEPLLQRADLVKFARYQPLPDEHDRSWDAARGFVQATIAPVPVNGGKEADRVGA